MCDAEKPEKDDVALTLSPHTRFGVLFTILIDIHGSTRLLVFISCRVSGWPLLVFRCSCYDYGGCGCSANRIKKFRSLSHNWMFLLSQWGANLKFYTWLILLSYNLHTLQALLTYLWWPYASKYGMKLLRVEERRLKSKILYIKLIKF